MQKIEREVSDNLKHLINYEDYNLIIEYSLNQIYPLSDSIILEDGIFSFTINSNNASHRLNFETLVRHIIIFEKELWEDEIENYINRIIPSDNDLDKYLDSFLIAENKLTLRLHPEDMYGLQLDYGSEKIDNNIEDYPHRVDFPEIYTVLALELEQRFHILKNDDIRKWNKSIKELFEIAERNLIDINENLKIGEYEINESRIITIFDGDFSAAYVCNFSESCSNCIGTLGTFVGIPNRGSAFIGIINQPNEISPIFNELVQRINKFYDEDPRQITRNLYWFYENRFELCILTWNEDGSISYDLPPKLLALVQ